MYDGSGLLSCYIVLVYSLYLICGSDGLFDVLSREEIAKTVLDAVEKASKTTGKNNKPANPSKLQNSTTRQERLVGDAPSSPCLLPSSAPRDSSGDALNTTAKMLDLLQDGCARLLEESDKRWGQTSNNYGDNVTATLVRFQLSCS